MYYIGIDVSKKDLSVFDGKKDLKFINKERLTSFKKYLNWLILKSFPKCFHSPINSYSSHFFYLLRFGL